MNSNDSRENHDITIVSMYDRGPHKKQVITIIVLVAILIVAALPYFVNAFRTGEGLETILLGIPLVFLFGSIMTLVVSAIIFVASSIGAFLLGNILNWDKVTIKEKKEHAGVCIPAGFALVYIAVVVALIRMCY